MMVTRQTAPTDLVILFYLFFLGKSMGAVNCLIEETHIWNNLRVSMTKFTFLGEIYL